MIFRLRRKVARSYFGHLCPSWTSTTLKWKISDFFKLPRVASLQPRENIFLQAVYIAGVGNLGGNISTVCCSLQNVTDTRVTCRRSCISVDGSALDPAFFWFSTSLLLKVTSSARQRCTSGSSPRNTSAILKAVPALLFCILKRYRKCRNASVVTDAMVQATAIDNKSGDFGNEILSELGSKHVSSSILHLDRAK